MPGFYGDQSVIDLLQLHQETGKLVTSGQLRYRPAGSTGDSTTTISWGNLYVWPMDESSGLGRDGYADIEGTITLWRIGETVEPRVDDVIITSGRMFLIRDIHRHINADEANNFAIYTCRVTT